jgi:DNA-binding beta-propeller fold protein YncE
MPPDTSSAAISTPYGSGAFSYVAAPKWSQLPRELALIEVTAVATDADGRAYLFNRGEHPVVVLDGDGNFVASWGAGMFIRPHGITIAPDGAVWCVDDLDHTVRKFSPEGQLLLTLGTSGVFSDTGARSVDYREVRQSAGPFNFPTNLAIAPDGNLYIADGYGNARVHVFSPDGRHVHSWGEPGRGPGQFHVPHGIAVDREGIVYVADRENSRVQRFTPQGELVDIWTDVARPCEVFVDDADTVYVAELGFRAGMFPGDEPGPGQTTGGRVSIFNRQGELLARWGGGDNPCSLGDFFAPHDVHVDRRGDIYVSEVTYTAGIRRGVIGEDAHTLQKFVRVRG